MIRPAYYPSAGEAWRVLAAYLLEYGHAVAPRGLKTKEVSHASLSFNMNLPVMACRDRKLSYSFMAAEPLWYLSGSDRLPSIAKYNPNMAKYSDDGNVLYGAYGPPIMAQIDYVTDCLIRDRHTRQAWLTIWKQNPHPSKDIPCTIALGFRITGGCLCCHVYMRSSDAYLGIPYDWFSFSIVAARIACEYNHAVKVPAERVQLGELFWTAASSHVYVENEEAIRQCLRSKEWVSSPQLPRGSIAMGDFTTIQCGLEARRDKLKPAAGLFDPKPDWGQEVNGSGGVLSQDCIRCGGEEQLPEA